jgi:nitroreductase
MNFYDLILSRRTIRQFAPRPVPREILENIVNAGRLAPSAANLQPLEFVVVDDETVRSRILPSLKWAAYIAPEGDPKSGHEPRAYIFTLINAAIRDKKYEYDVGAAMENMILAALSKGIASCWLISIDKPNITRLLEIPESRILDSVLALGFPAQKSLVEALRNSPRYWQDADLTFHVPKRPLEAVIHFNKF